MTEPERPADHRQALAQDLRSVRAAYDQLERGESAAIRRARDAAELALEGVFWRIGGATARRERHLAHVVLAFPLAEHRTMATFSFGLYLQRAIGANASGLMRFRRLLASRDRDELDRRLRALLRLAAKDGAPVDWGVLGADVLWFFASSDRVRRRWAQDFYAPIASERSTSPSKEIGKAQ
jgi:CRISPR type I-E-associated protein CasB/Cse2